MEARELQTVDDLLLSPEERVELIGGEIIRRPMARIAHANVQGNTRSELTPFTRASGPGGGWWIATEVSVADEGGADRPCAGWRRVARHRHTEGSGQRPPAAI